MLNTLYARLTAGLLVISLVATALFLAIDLASSRRLLQEVNQDVHRDLAEQLLKESIPLEDGKVQPEALEHIFHMLMVINPAIEVYLLGRNGEVLAYSAPKGSVVRMAVDLDPIRRLLAGKAKLPILGDDPKSARDRKVFSAAPLASGDGYLYVILGGRQYQSTAAMLETSRVVRLGLGGLVATLLAAIAAGLWLFARITRPVRTLAASVRRFQSGGFESPDLLEAASAKSAGRGHHPDEIESLEQSFSDMAERLTEQMRELKKSDALRRELVANVSHDLRTPITSLRGYLETLIVKDAQLSDQEKHDYLETALRHSERLSELVASLFELSKLDSLTTEVQRERVALGEFLHDVLQGFSLRSRERGIELVAAIDHSKPAFVETDIGLLERVLGNLLENAIRHTPRHGRVTLRLLHEEGLNEEERYRIAVEDTGPGIAEEDLPHLFDRFYRKSTSPAARQDGAGLGLAIAKQILELLDSSLEVTTVHGPPETGSTGSGSTFSFVLGKS